MNYSGNMSAPIAQELMSEVLLALCYLIQYVAKNNNFKIQVNLQYICQKESGEEIKMFLGHDL